MEKKYVVYIFVKYKRMIINFMKKKTIYNQCLTFVYIIGKKQSITSVKIYFQIGKKQSITSVKILSLK